MNVMTLEQEGPDFNLILAASSCWLQRIRSSQERLSPAAFSVSWIKTTPLRVSDRKDGDDAVKRWCLPGIQKALKKTHPQSLSILTTPLPGVCVLVVNTEKKKTEGGEHGAGLPPPPFSLPCQFGLGLWGWSTNRYETSSPGEPSRGPDRGHPRG